MPCLYPDVKGILYALKDKGIDVAIASRSSTLEIAKTILDKLGIQSLFVAQEIFSSVTHKTELFQRIHNKTKIPYTDMLFFDNEHRNIIAVKFSHHLLLFSFF
ncbi:Magnesium-dependent phosphatase 1 [Bienertia sinuspersici]